MTAIDNWVQSASVSDPGTLATVKDGDRYIVNPPGLGAWAMLDNNIVDRVSGAWVPTPPVTGLQVFDQDGPQTLVYDGSAWSALPFNTDMFDTSHWAKGVLAPAPSASVLTVDAAINLVPGGTTLPDGYTIFVRYHDVFVDDTATTPVHTPRKPGYAGFFVYDSTDTTAFTAPHALGFVDLHGRVFKRWMPDNRLHSGWYCYIDGATDDLANLNAFLTDSLAYGQVYVCDPGNYHLSGTLDVPNTSTEYRITLEGYGAIFDNTIRFLGEGISAQGLSVISGPANGFEWFRGQGGDFRDLYAGSNSGHGFTWGVIGTALDGRGQITYSNYTSCFAEGNHRDGFHAEILEPHSWLHICGFFQCTARGNGGDGFFFGSGADYNSFYALECESNNLGRRITVSSTVNTPMIGDTVGNAASLPTATGTLVGNPAMNVYDVMWDLAGVEFVVGDTLYDGANVVGAISAIVNAWNGRGLTMASVSGAFTQGDTLATNLALTGLSVTPAMGGTGYLMNDMLTLVGGTHTSAAVVEVTGVSGGAITAVSVQSGGNYTTAPATFTATGGSGSGAHFQLPTYSAIPSGTSLGTVNVFTNSGTTADLVVLWDPTTPEFTPGATVYTGTVSLARGQVSLLTQMLSGTDVVGTFLPGETVYDRAALASVTPSAAGSGYAPGDSLTPSGPTAVTPGVITVSSCGLNTLHLTGGGGGYTANQIVTLTGGTFTTAAQIKVTAVSSGAITAFIIATPGVYTGTLPATFGASGGATFDTPTWGVTAATVTTAGSYSTATGSFAVTGGSGTGAEFDVVWAADTSATDQGTLNAIYGSALSVKYGSGVQFLYGNTVIGGTSGAYLPAIAAHPAGPGSAAITHWAGNGFFYGGQFVDSNDFVAGSDFLYSGHTQIYGGRWVGAMIATDDNFDFVRTVQPDGLTQSNAIEFMATGQLNATNVASSTIANSDSLASGGDVYLGRAWSSLPAANISFLTTATPNTFHIAAIDTGALTLANGNIIELDIDLRGVRSFTSTAYTSNFACWLRALLSVSTTATGNLVSLAGSTTLSTIGCSSVVCSLHYSQINVTGVSGTFGVGHVVKDGSGNLGVLADINGSVFTVTGITNSTGGFTASALSGSLTDQTSLASATIASTAVNAPRAVAVAFTTAQIVLTEDPRVMYSDFRATQLI